MWTIKHAGFKKEKTHPLDACPSITIIELVFENGPLTLSFTHQVNDHGLLQLSSTEGFSEETIAMLEEAGFNKTEESQNLVYQTSDDESILAAFVKLGFLNSKGLAPDCPMILEPFNQQHIEAKFDGFKAYTLATAAQTAQTRRMLHRDVLKRHDCCELSFNHGLEWKPEAVRKVSFSSQVVVHTITPTDSQKAPDLSADFA